MKEQNPESVDIHDPYINAKFIAIMGAEDNLELARSFAVALPINDPPAEAPAKTAAPAGDTLTKSIEGNVASATRDTDVVTGTDKDGDKMRCSYVQGVTQDDYQTDAAFIFSATPGGFLMPIEHIGGFIAWLQSRVAKHAKGEAA